MKVNHPVQYNLLPLEALPESNKTGDHCYTRHVGDFAIAVRVRAPTPLHACSRCRDR